MEINRRRFCQALTGVVALSGTVLPGIGMAKDQPLFSSAAKDTQGHYHLYLMGQDGTILLDHPLPERAHHVEAHPKRPLLACIARRPGTFIDIVDYHQGLLVKRIEAKPERHFFGHGIFSEDGRYLIVPENNLVDGEGRIVVRDLKQDFAIIADLPSYGIGPHELKLVPGSSRLMVANGGILTHPNSGREKLNLDTMQPSLVAIDLNSGALLEQHRLPEALHQLSIRHLDCNFRGETVIALQYQGEVDQNPPLVAVHRPGAPLKLLSAPEEIHRAMKRYCGSSRFDQSGRFAAISAPRGDLITFWDLHNNQFHSAIKSRDGCGISATSKTAEFLITTGAGRCTRHNLLTGMSNRLPQAISPAWDNHLTTVSL